ncbi:MAG: hypothetical protein QOI20_2406 [Acidimicrobiaceae bacterium]|nr:hypothetical protein [Acidimicrobiaceae bacterium]
MIVSSAPATKRAYDAAARQARAEQERAATRRRVVQAAVDLFTERGYVATTMADVAERAGVALQSVYKAGSSKFDLLHLAADVAVAGDHDQVLLKDRPDIAGLADEPDLRRQVEAFARFASATVNRALPLLIAEREAAAVEPRAAERLHAVQLRRLDTFKAAAANLHLDQLPQRAKTGKGGGHSKGNKGGTPGTKAADVARTLWAIASPEVCILQRRTLGWSARQHADWLAAVLPRALGLDAG